MKKCFGYRGKYEKCYTCKDIEDCSIKTVERMFPKVKVVGP
jgi:hypothetical protein